MPLHDLLGRPLRKLRLSVTDRCNLRCAYCMPEEEYVWLPRKELLSFEELARLVDVFVALGTDELRLTGGEPLLRRGLEELVRALARKQGVRDLALTTNGILLGAQAAALRAAGLARLTVSLDSLRPERFLALTRRDALPEVLAGLEAARRAGFEGIKLNCVLARGRNEDEVPALLEFARARRFELRFIEYMDVGGATRWSSAEVVPRAEILERVEAAFGPVRALPDAERASAPAERFELACGARFGIIASTTAPFCSACDRARLTADGRLYTCLYGREGLDLRSPLRAGETPEALARRIAAAWGVRRDRGAEERLAADERAPLADAGELRSDPHLEMHTRGG